MESRSESNPSDREVKMSKRVLLAALACLIVFALGGAPVKSAKKSAKPAKTKVVAKAKAPKARPSEPAAPVQSQYRKSPYVGAISYDATTGQVLFEDNADAKAYPASVTKLMTLLLVMEDVRAGKYALADLATATADVRYSEPSWVGIREGEKMSVRDLCMALMVSSANDAAIVLGVHSAGSLTGFVERMNARAAAIGMTHTTYCNPNGLPPTSSKGRSYPWKSFNSTTARDQLLLAKELVLKHPEIFEFTSVKTCDLVKMADGRYRTSVTRRKNEPLKETQLAEGEETVLQLRNHNNIMRTDKLKIINPDGTEAVDGLKTGYIDAGGSSIVLTGVRGKKRAIVVVLGSASAKERDANARRMLVDALGALAM